MNKYSFSDIEIGMRNSFEVKISKSHMSQFLNITGDKNPIHVNSHYAKSHGMKDIVVYGMLTSSFYSTLVGVYLPGKYALLHSIEVQFIKPVFIGDRLLIEGEVTDKNELFNQIILKSSIRNQHSTKVSRAKIKIGILDEK